MSAVPGGTVTHIRCGDDLREGLRVAGLGGRYLAVTDPLCRGPVPATGDLHAVRAAFLARAYGVDEAVERQRLEVTDRDLGAALVEGAAVLWFEHDSYDQLILARVLARIDAVGAFGASLVCIDRHPSHARFIGLGQLDPAELRALWPMRRAVTPELARLGTAVWPALRASDPSELAALAASGTPPLPPLAPALRRHLEELPWTGDGLGLTQRLVLRALVAGAANPGEVFRRLQDGLEPLPFLGDRMLWADIRELAAWRDPPLELMGDAPWPRRPLRLTAIGERLLAGTVDAASLGPAERWVGGVRLDDPAAWWRWNAVGGRLARETDA